jgi:serine/tyrosine/threonine adenylyltransferase
MFNFDHTYAQLPEVFFAPAEPQPAPQPRIALYNQALANVLGLPAITDKSTLAAMLCGNALPARSQPLAQAYAGHQFGHFTMLGDGRALLLGEHIDPHGQRWDIQFKGSGITPFSRRGDGKAALGPMLREYLISEAMAALGIPTTRSLAVVSTGETVYRDEPLPGAVLTRVAASHIRVGTFEYAYQVNLQQPGVLKALADYTVQRHYPDAQETENPYLAMLHAVIDRQAWLVAQWMRVGFIHGVMNTDNMTLSGETIDYGPCAFMDAYDPRTVFSSIDRDGRYAYGSQPGIAQWNLARLAESLLPLIDPDRQTAEQMATGAVAQYSQRFRQHWLGAMRGKLGLPGEQPEDEDLIFDLLELMHQHQADFTLTFRQLNVLPHDHPLQSAEAFKPWQSRWRQRLGDQSTEQTQTVMDAHNPAIIPRNHAVEAALEAATRQQDFAPCHAVLQAMAQPYQTADRPEALLQPTPSSDIPYQTFCGT